MDNFELLMYRADKRRVEVTENLDRSTQQRLGQYFTHRRIAEFMARSFTLNRRADVSILDPGAGVGVLAAALVRELLASGERPKSITVLTCEIDPNVRPRLLQTLLQCHEACRSLGVQFTYLVEPTDFIVFAVEIIAAGLFEGKRSRLAFDYVIMNPPYQKLSSDSDHSAQLRSIKLHAPNLYAAFVLLASYLLCEDNGQLVAITPRSFCNGTYFKKFRTLLLERGNIDHLHTFPSRSVAFSDNRILQENVIFRYIRGSQEPEFIRVTEGNIVDNGLLIESSHRSSQVVDRNDPELVIHIPTIARMKTAPANGDLKSGLAHLQIRVSTGKVVDFRVREHLHDQPSLGAAPLIYPQHIAGLGIRWPKSTAKKPNAISKNKATLPLLHKPGYYVVVKRFSAKEERRRVYAAVLEPNMVGDQPFAIENHLNYFHKDGAGLDKGTARGLTAYLNTTQLDAEFRRFSGHTQVNAGDLARLAYPPEAKLRAIGRRIINLELTQNEIDKIVEEELETEGSQRFADPEDCGTAKEG